MSTSKTSASGKNKKNDTLRDGQFKNQIHLQRKFSVISSKNMFRLSRVGFFYAELVTNLNKKPEVRTPLFTWNAFINDYPDVVHPLDQNVHVVQMRWYKRHTWSWSLAAPSGCRWTQAHTNTHAHTRTQLGLVLALLLWAFTAPCCSQWNYTHTGKGILPLQCVRSPHFL